jgi:hypothetical protein
MSIVGFVTATESVFEVVQQDLNRCSLRSRRRTAWWELSARLFCAPCQGALFSPVKDRAGKLFAPAGSTRCFGELNPQAAFLPNWRIEVIAFKLAAVAPRQDPAADHQPATASSKVADRLDRLSGLVSRARPFGLRVLRSVLLQPEEERSRPRRAGDLSRDRGQRAVLRALP